MTATLLPPAPVLHRALERRDRSFEGLFVVAVRTTGVFCRPGCPARTPRRENVECFASGADAIAAGYRACRRCRPLEPAGAAAAAGFLSPSGFRAAFARAFGAAPSRAGEAAALHYSRIQSPLGPLAAAATQRGVCLLAFADEGLEDELRGLQRRLAAAAVPEPNDPLRRLEDELADYFAGGLREFGVPLHLLGTPFQVAAWNALRRIPYGETWSYEEQARSISRPRALRAIGQANGRNRVAIVVPCHRVVRSDGSIGGYGGGLWRKRWLLEHEFQATSSLALPPACSHQSAPRHRAQSRLGASTES